MKKQLRKNDPISLESKNMKLFFNNKANMLCSIAFFLLFNSLLFAISNDYCLDCAFGKDDLMEIDILFADTENGIFAYQMDTSLVELIKKEPCKHQISPMREAYSVRGGGVIHLIKGLNPPMNYCNQIPIAIFNDDTLLFHTQEKSSFSDGRPDEERVMTWGVRFHGNTWDDVDVYLYRKIQFTMHDFRAVQIIEQRFEPLGEAIYNRKHSFIKSDSDDEVIFDMRSLKQEDRMNALSLTQKQCPHVYVDRASGGIFLAGEVVLEGEASVVDYFPHGYFYPDMDSQRKYMVFVEKSRKKSIFTGQKSTLKLLNLENNHITSLKVTKNVIINPKISPNGKWILFIEDGVLCVMNTETKSARKIARAVTANWAYRFNREDVRK